MSISALMTTLANPRVRFFGMVALWGAIVALHPAIASAQQFSDLTNNINGFKNALKGVCSALVVIGLVSSGIGWMMRSQEGLGPVFWGGITMVGAGSLVLLGDNFVSSLGGTP